MAAEIDQELLAAVRPMIKKGVGTLSDIPEELRNTIANIYYGYCKLARHMLSGHLDPTDVESKGYDRAMDDMMRDWAFLQSSVECLPACIASLRKLPEQFRGSNSVYVFFYLAQFKYRFVDDNPFLFWIKLKVMLKRHFSPPQEIPELWRIIDGASDGS